MNSIVRSVVVGLLSLVTACPLVWGQSRSGGRSSGSGSRPPAQPSRPQPRPQPQSTPARQQSAPARQQTASPARPQATTPARQQATNQARQQATTQARQQAGAQARQQATAQARQQAATQARQQAAARARQQAATQARQQAAAQARQQAVNRARQQAVAQARQQAVNRARQQAAAQARQQAQARARQQTTGQIHSENASPGRGFAPAQPRAALNAGARAQPVRPAQELARQQAATAARERALEQARMAARFQAARGVVPAVQATARPTPTSLITTPRLPWVDVGSNTPPLRYDVVFTNKFGTVTHHEFNSFAEAKKYADEYRKGLYSLEDGVIRNIEIKPLVTRDTAAPAPPRKWLDYDDNAPKGGRPAAQAATAKGGNAARPAVFGPPAPPVSPVSPGQLREIMPGLSRTKVAQLTTPLLAAMSEFGINTPKRQAAFLAQVAHESGQLRFLVEKPSEHSGKSFENYDGRTDLGNTQPGDGARYRGRGPIQLTGRANYRAAGAALGLDLENQPNLVADPAVGLRVAAWYWQTHGLNERADVGSDEEFQRISNIVNRGRPNPKKPALHSQERLDFYHTAVEALEPPPAPMTP
jgi:predicted chitinase